MATVNPATMNQHATIATGDGAHGSLNTNTASAQLPAAARMIPVNADRLPRQKYSTVSTRKICRRDAPSVRSRTPSFTRS